MAFQTADKQKSFGSAYKTKKYDEFHASEDSPQHGNAVDEAVANTDAPVEPKEHDKDTHPAVSANGAAHSVTISRNPDGSHHVSAQHPNGMSTESDHQTSAEAHEQGGKLCAVSLKKSGEEGPQAGAASEGDNDNVDSFEMPDLA